MEEGASGIPLDGPPYALSGTRDRHLESREKRKATEEEASKEESK